MCVCVRIIVHIYIYTHELLRDLRCLGISGVCFFGWFGTRNSLKAGKAPENWVQTEDNRLVGQMRSPH